MTNEGSSLWTGFFTQPMQTGGMAHTMAVQACYTVVFLIAAAVWFTRSDVLS